VHWTFMAAISVHVLAGVFWAGSTFALARNGMRGLQQLFKPQMAAAGVAVLSGGYLWQSFHKGAFGRAENILVIAMGLAIVALAVQGLSGGLALRAMRRGAHAGAAPRPRVAVVFRATAILLAVTVVGMVAARYV
jgi:hypothetical protein